MACDDRTWRTFPASLWDLFLEARCALCAAPSSLEDAWLCEEHRLAIEALGGSACRTCARPTPHGDRVCGRCTREPPPWRELVCALRYHGAARELLLAAKLGRRAALMRPLAARLAPRLRARAWMRAIAIVPVPLHARRRRERGFNQVECAATWLAERCGARVVLALRRVRATRPQGDPQTLSRRANVRGAFALRRRHSPRRALLLDDVMTSGATLRECARRLRAGGCKELYAAAIFRALPLQG